MRSIWSGTISFGLVSVAVRMFPATESKELRFHFLDRSRPHAGRLREGAQGLARARAGRLDGDLGAVRLQKAEAEMAKTLVENLSEPFEPEKYTDAYRKELLQLTRAKAKGQKLPEPETEEEGEVVDLMTALRESVERTKRKRAAPRRRAKRAS